MDGNPHPLWFEKGGGGLASISWAFFRLAVVYFGPIAQPVFPFRIGGQWTESCEGGL
jgi:hypothetical protein